MLKSTTNKTIKQKMDQQSKCNKPAMTRNMCYQTRRQNLLPNQLKYIQKNQF